MPLDERKNFHGALCIAPGDIARESIVLSIQRVPLRRLCE